MFDGEETETIEVQQEQQNVDTQLHVIYCGPTLPASYGLRQYQTFIGGLQAHIAETVKECPAISGLVVPVAELAMTRIAVERKGSAEAALYNQINQYFKKG